MIDRILCWIIDFIIFILAVWFLIDSFFLIFAYKLGKIIKKLYLCSGNL